MNTKFKTSYHMTLFSVIVRLWFRCIFARNLFGL